MCNEHMPDSGNKSMETGVMNFIQNYESCESHHFYTGEYTPCGYTCFNIRFPKSGKCPSSGNWCHLQEIRKAIPNECHAFFVYQNKNKRIRFCLKVHGYY